MNVQHASKNEDVRDIPKGSLATSRALKALSVFAVALIAWAVVVAFILIVF